MHAKTRSLFRCAHLACLALAFLAAGFGPPALANLTDDFNRADNAALGNGWIEKNPAIFSIAGNQVQKNAQSSGYLDNLAYRPASEDVADVEVSVEMRVLAGTPGYPQIFTRIQSADVGDDSSLNGYMLYVNDSNTQAILGRQSGSAFVTTLATLTLSPALNQTDTFRLRMRSTGTNPVQLAAYIERLNSGTWQIIGQASYDDSAAERFATAGTVGFGGYTEASYRFDNFIRTNLGGGNPAPSTTSLQPNTALAGESGFTLTVSGGNFVANSVVRWNGANRPTTFISASVLEAQIAAGDLASAGTASVTVFTPTPGGGTSNAQSFTISSNPTPNPVPIVTTLAPNNANAGGAQFTLTVNGSNFASNAAVRWNGSNRATTFVSSTQLTATITAADIATSSTATVTVFNPAPGGGVSNGAIFTINAPANPMPVMGGINPSSATAGGSGFTLTVTGSSFVNGAIVRWNGANRTTTFVSATQLTATISAGDIGAAGNQSVTVFNPAPGGGTSNALAFTVNPGGGGGGTPTITALSPISAAAGAGSTQITVNGSGFTSSSVVRWNGNNRTTTFLSSTQVRITASSSDLANATVAAITVNNPAGGGGGTSQPLSFFVLASGTSVFNDTFNRANSSNIGNGWTEKTPAAFSIAGNQVNNSGENYPFTYRDNLVYRTAIGEDQLNVETSIEFIRGANANFPQVHARVQRNTIAQPGIMEGYILYVDDYLTPMALAIAVQPPVGINECTLRIMEFPTPLVDGTRYRLRLLVQNSYPAQLTGILERFDGNAWQVFVSGSFTHDNNTPMNPALFCPYQSVPPPVTASGAVAFSKWYDAVDVYDNFYWRSLGGAGSSLPSLNSLAPNSATSGGAAFSLTLNGSGFTSSSVARWNGSNRTTTFISATQLQAAITAADIATAGTAAVTVFNPGAGGGTSPQTLNFAITPPVAASFVDDFTRPDSDSLGNGWIEKAPSAFFLEGGQASKQAFYTDYTNGLVYRPAGEDVLNVEAAVQMRLRGSTIGYPQLVARMLSNTANTEGGFDGYLLYIDDNSTRAYLGRQRGSTLTSLAGITISPALNTTDTYRLRLTVTGTTSVQLQAFVERLNGASWQIIGQASFTDTSAQRISGVGTVGFGGYIENSYTYDNFTRNNLGP